MQQNLNQKNNLMKKLLFSLVVLAFVGVSCDCQAPADQDEKTEQTASPKVIDINNFDATAEGLGDQVVEIKGTVVHTCKHGGTKMFITGDDPDFRLKVTATDESGNFNLEMEGSDYVVVGILDEYRVDMAELDKLEAEVLAENPAQEEMKHKGGHDGDDHADHAGDSHQEAEGSCAAELAQISDLRARVKETEKGYLSFYSILAKSYKEAK